MKIENLNDLKKLIQLCQKTGVKYITVGDISLDIGERPQKIRRAFKKAADEYIKQLDPITGMLTEPIETPDELSEEQLLMWSSAPGGIQSGGDNQ